MNQQPGHFEVDLGTSLRCEYFRTLPPYPANGGCYHRLERACGRPWDAVMWLWKTLLSASLARLPFPVLEIHPDNGSEFLNHHLLRFWKDQSVEGVAIITQSRLGRRMTIVLWNRKMTLWCGLMWATSDWIPLLKPTCSTNCMNSCGCITISFSL